LYPEFCKESDSPNLGRVKRMQDTATIGDRPGISFGNSSFNSTVTGSALIVSEIRFLRDSLAEVLIREKGMRECGQAPTLEAALVTATLMRPEILLLDVAFPGGTQTATQLCRSAPSTKVIAFGVCETEEQVLSWAQTGVAGYVPNTASVVDLVSLITQISCGEQSCSSRIAGSLFRHVASAGSRRSKCSLAAQGPPLTKRESQILQLMGAGFSNKEIARRLRISLGTTKTHVHNLMSKLSLHRRTDVMVHLHGASSF
jgi:two-component system, NarL family, nitrate/nitrite response regulator NarL